MSGSDGKSHSQRSRPLDVRTSRVWNSLHHKHQDEGDQSLNEHRLSGVQGGIKRGHSQSGTDQSVKGHLDHSRSGDGTHQLDDDVEGSLQDADLADNKEAQGDGRVYVAATQVTQALKNVESKSVIKF